MDLVCRVVQRYLDEDAEPRHRRFPRAALLERPAAR
jgi:hypothetical protein